MISIAHHIIFIVINIQIKRVLDTNVFTDSRMDLFIVWGWGRSGDLRMIVLFIETFAGLYCTLKRIMIQQTAMSILVLQKAPSEGS